MESRRSRSKKSSGRDHSDKSGSQDYSSEEDSPNRYDDDNKSEERERPSDSRRNRDRSSDEEKEREDKNDDDYLRRREESQQEESSIEEEYKQEEEEKLEEPEKVELQPLISKPIVYERGRSHILPLRERAVLERDVLGLPEKSELLKSGFKKGQEDALNKNKPAPLDSEKEILRKLENDGVYKIGASSDNIVTHTLTKPVDLSLRHIIRTKVKSAILSERINSIKKRHFKLELLIGKLILRSHPLFNAEDAKAVEVKELHEEFERVAGLGMIPFYDDRIESLKDELYRAEGAKKIDEDHIKFLKATLKDVRKKKVQEKKLIKELGIKLYERWVELRLIREKQDFESTSVDLKAREFDLPNRRKEIIFYLNHKEPLEKTLSGRSIPSSETSRRKHVRNLKARIDIFVNGFKVESTRETNLSWPGFEAEFGDLFTIFLYTMPQKIELKLYINSQEISIFPVEVPGTKVEALTSAYAIAREVRFSRDEFLKEKQLNKERRRGTDIKKEREELKKLEDENDKIKEGKLKEDKKNGAQGAVSGQNNVPAAQVVEAPKPKDLIAEFKKIKQDISGFLYFKGEWKGEGKDMPPVINPEQEKERDRTIEKATGLRKTKLFDINDPRFENIVKTKKEKNEHLKMLIEKDSMNPLHDLQPFRHIQLVNQDTHYELNRIDIPLTESEVVNDPILSMLIEKFSKLGALQTYNQMLHEVKSFGPSERLQDMSQDVLERRQIFMEKIKRVEKDIKTGKSKPYINYNTVVDEMGGFEAQNPFVGLIQKIFAPRRKLRPRVVDKPTVSISSVNEAIIKVQIISGINIPVRAESIRAIEELNKQINGPQKPTQPSRDAPQFGRNTGNGPANLPRDGYDRDEYPRDRYNRNDNEDRKDLDRSRGDYPERDRELRRPRSAYPQDDYDRPSYSRNDDYNRPRSGYQRDDYNRPRSNPPRDDYDRSRSGYPRDDYDRSPGGYPREDYDRSRSGYPKDDYDRSPGGYSNARDQYDRSRGDYPPRDSYGGREYEGGSEDGDDYRRDQDQFTRYEGPLGARTQYDATAGQRRGLPLGNTLGASQRPRDNPLGASQVSRSGFGGNRNNPPYSGVGTVADPYRNTFRSQGFGSSAFGLNYGANQPGQPNDPGRRPQELDVLGKTRLELTGMRKLIQGSVFIEVRYVSDRFGHEETQIRRTRECNGSFPDWNETLSFKIFPKNAKALSEEELIKGNDTLYFSIFDK